MATKQYHGEQPGQIAGVPNWRGGPYITASEQIQNRIERHPWFKMGLIKIVTEDVLGEEVKEERSTDVDLPDSWDDYIDGLTYKELQDLAKDRGIRYVGVSAVKLQAELKTVGG